MQLQAVLVLLGLVLIPALIFAVIMRTYLLLRSDGRHHNCPKCTMMRLRSYPAPPTKRFGRH